MNQQFSSEELSVIEKWNKKSVDVFVFGASNDHTKHIYKEVLQFLRPEAGETSKKELSNPDDYIVISDEENDEPCRKIKLIILDEDGDDEVEEETDVEVITISDDEA